MCIPFAWTHEAVRPITYDSEDWIGAITPGQEWYYADYFLLLTFGGIPWQVNIILKYYISVYPNLFDLEESYFTICIFRCTFKEFCRVELRQEPKYCPI